MKRLLTTAAMALALGAGGAFAETKGSAISAYEFEASKDFYASSFIGMRVYASENDVDSDATVANDSEQSWDDIGEINDLIITKDGEIEAVIVGVGGFLGLGEKDVAVSMDQIKVLRDDDGDRFLVTRVSEAELNDATAFTPNERDDREVANNEMTDEQVAENEDAANEDATNDRIERVEMTKEREDTLARYDASREPLIRPDVEAEAYVEISADELTLEALEDAAVVGSNGETVGEIEQVFISAEGKVKRVIVDVGGFLGLGERPVSISFDEMKLMRRNDGDDIRIYIDATEEALEAQPAYEG